MPDYQERARKELEALDERIVKLENFLLSDAIKKLNAQDGSLLRQQLGTMRDYSRILTERVKGF